MPKNHTLHLKIEKESQELLKEVSTKIKIPQSVLARLLLNKSLMDLKVLAQTEGWDNILFTRYQKTQI